MAITKTSRFELPYGYREAVYSYEDGDVTRNGAAAGTLASASVKFVKTNKKVEIFFDLDFTGATTTGTTSIEFALPIGSALLSEDGDAAFFEPLEFSTTSTLYLLAQGESATLSDKFTKYIPAGEVGQVAIYQPAAGVTAALSISVQTVNIERVVGSISYESK